MTCSGLDMTIDGMLADPVIGAAMRADRVDPHRLERLLRSTARELAAGRRTPPLPRAALADRIRDVVRGSTRGW